MKPFDSSHQAELLRKIIDLGQLEDSLIDKWNERDTSGNLWPHERSFYHEYLSKAKRTAELRSLRLNEYDRLYGGVE